MRTIAHISDLHFGNEHDDMEEVLLKDLIEVQPTLIAVSGDLTQRALRRQFKRARKFLERLPSPFIVVPGNHDVPLFDVLRRFFLPLHRYKNYISEELNPLYADNEMAVLGVNTARSMALESGKISKRQMIEAKRILMGLEPEVFRLVVTHHPFTRSLPQHKMRRVLAGASDVLSSFEECQVDIVLSGHFHASHSQDLRDSFAHIDRSILHIQAGTALGTKTPTESNEYNLLTLSKDNVDIDIRHWTPDGFQKKSTITYARMNGHWKKKG